ncbi:MAG TPA: hypothetical protein VE988_12730, partial [Gemmataceae bacterium]|nr:hypothetical protein [Gemmataceae bacterium]
MVKALYLAILFLGVAVFVLVRTVTNLPGKPKEKREAVIAQPAKQAHQERVVEAVAKKRQDKGPVEAKKPADRPMNFTISLDKLTMDGGKLQPLVINVPPPPPVDSNPKVAD